MPNTVTITGFKEYAAKLERVAKEFPDDLDFIAKEAADSWARLADRSAPKDFGKLHGYIKASPVKSGVWEVTSPQEYSAYMEWGTKSRAVIPADLQAYAAQFRGPGTGKNPKELIYAWVLRKGLGKEAQWPIFISIMRTGVNPHPFFFKHREFIQTQMNGDLKQLLETLD